MAKNGNSNNKDKAPPPPLPADLIKSLPAAVEIVKHLVAIERLYPKLVRELSEARAGGSIALSRAFVVFHRLMTVFANKAKPFEDLFKRYKELECPQVFENDGITHVPLTDGYRVTISYSLRASVIPDRKDAAYDWLRENHPDVMIETVNASTLSALARQLSSEQNVTLPEDLFKSVNLPGTSVTRT